MKVTIAADTGAQDIEITREVHGVVATAQRLVTVDGLLTSAVGDVRRAAGLPDDGEPGVILAAWRRIVHLVGADDPLPLSPASVVDRVAMLVEAERKAADR